MMLLNLRFCMLLQKRSNTAKSPYYETKLASRESIAQPQPEKANDCGTSGMRMLQVMIFYRRWAVKWSLDSDNRTVIL